MKQCTRCKEIKPLSEYYKCANRKDGLMPHCRDCQKKAQKESKEDYSSLTRTPTPIKDPCEKTQGIREAMCVQLERYYQRIPDKVQKMSCLKADKKIAEMKIPKVVDLYVVNNNNVNTDNNIELFGFIRKPRHLSTSV